MTTPYTGGANPTFAIKRTGDATVLPQDTTDSDLTTVNIYKLEQLTSWGSTGAGTVTATFAGTASAGAALLVIAYTTPIDIS